MSDEIKLISTGEVNELIKKHELERIDDGGDSSQVLVFDNGTKVNVFNDWFNGEGIKYQLLVDEM